MWEEWSRDAEAPAQWRFSLEHPASGQRRGFASLAALVAALQELLTEKEKYPMSTINKTILRRFFEELFSRGDLSVADEIVALDYVNHNPVPGEPPGREGLKGFVVYLRAAFPDIHFTVEEQLVEGDKVVTRWTATGTQQGECAGIAATGKPVNVTAINIHRSATAKSRKVGSTGMPWACCSSLARFLPQARLEHSHQDRSDGPHPHNKIGKTSSRRFWGQSQGRWRGERQFN
jgi:predicted ester cyclase